MTITVGSTPVQSIYVGSTPVQAVYVGSNLVWPAGTTYYKWQNTYGVTAYTTTRTPSVGDRIVQKIGNSLCYTSQVTFVSASYFTTTSMGAVSVGEPRQWTYVGTEAMAQSQPVTAYAWTWSSAGWDDITPDRNPSVGDTIYGVDYREWWSSSDTILSVTTDGGGNVSQLVPEHAIAGVHLDYNGPFQPTGVISCEGLNATGDGSSYSFPVSSGYSNIINGAYRETFALDSNSTLTLTYPGSTTTSKVLLKPKGLKWSSASLVSNLGSNYWEGITYDGTKFVALGTQGHISTSTDGINWTTVSYISNLGQRAWCNLEYGNGTFVAVGKGDGYVSTSTNGTTWTAASASITNKNWSGITFGDGMFMVVSSDGYVATSGYGTSWSSPTDTGAGSSYWRDIAYGNGKFVIINMNGYISYKYHSGSTWSTPTNALGSVDDWYNLTFQNGRFVAVGYAGYVSTSRDGTNWTTPVQNLSSTTGGWRDIAYGAGKFVAIGRDGYISTSSGGDLVCVLNTDSTTPGVVLYQITISPETYGLTPYWEITADKRGYFTVTGY